MLPLSKKGLLEKKKNNVIGNVRFDINMTYYIHDGMQQKSE